MKVWAFDEAPAEYQELSTNGGDEDWVLFIPDAYGDDYMPGFAESWELSFFDIQDFTVEGGRIRIASHA